ncbi:MAG: hypothetical protein K6D94_05415, partial [Clostridiales bacterium]|nr:hypothetical protein [Clostridiales bacterium]
MPSVFSYPNVSLPFSEPAEEAVSRAIKAAGRYRPDTAVISRKAIDARKKNDIRFVYTVSLEWKSGLGEKAGRWLAEHGFREAPAAAEPIGCGSETLTGRPLIVGFGPCGMFCALRLAERGYRPVVIERGQPVAKRVEDVSRFRMTGVLDTESNVQFGAGGAGLFSDGKLMTRINDPRITSITEDFIKFGADEGIRIAAKPHIGTDRLAAVADAADKRIRDLGGEIIYGCRLDDIRISGGRAVSAVTTKGEMSCGPVVLATGHSARDTYSMLKQRGFALQNKPFSVGVRIEHKREFIDTAMYGAHAGDPLLGAADYNFSLRRGEEAVYTFCMCPGGTVVAAASETGGVVVNGMSYSSRDGENSNAAVAVSVSPEDPVGFQRRLEQEAYRLGGGGYAAPFQTFGAFEKGEPVFDLGKVTPSYNGNGTAKANIRQIFPERISSFLTEGIRYFGTKLRGFDASDAILTAVESRT